MATNVTIPRAESAEHHHEGPVAQMIERQTMNIPSDIFLLAAGGSIAGSLALEAMGRHQGAIFVGQWAPVFLILGLHNKLIKMAGADSMPA